MLASIFYSISLLEIYPKDSKLNGCLGSQLGSILLCIRELTLEGSMERGCLICFSFCFWHKMCYSLIASGEVTDH